MGTSIRVRRRGRRRGGSASRRPASTCGSLGPFDAAGVPELVHVDVHPGGRGHTHLDLRYLFDGGHAEDGCADPAPPEGESQEIGWFDWDAAIDHRRPRPPRRPDLPPRPPLSRPRPEDRRNRASGERFAGIFRARVAGRVAMTNVCSILGEWGSTTHPGPGTNSKRRCPTGLHADRARRARPGEPVVELRWRRAGLEPQTPAVRGAERPRRPPEHGTVPYAELHCHSNFSFLDGASHPEELATEAARLGLEALAITDHNGFYGVVRFAEAAKAVGLPTVFGTEITLMVVTVRLCPGGPIRGGHDRPGRDRAGARLARTRSARHAPAGDRRRARRVRPIVTGAQRRSPRRREGRAAVRLRRSRHRARRPRLGAHRLSQGGGAGGVDRRRTGRGTTRAAADGRGVRARPGARRAVGSRRPARLRPQRCARRDRPSRRGGVRGDEQRPLRHTRRNGNWPPPWPPCGPGAASTRSTRGSRRHRAPISDRAPNSSAGSAATPVWSNGPPRSVGPRRSTSRSSPPTCRRSPVRRPVGAS